MIHDKIFFIVTKYYVLDVTKYSLDILSTEKNILKRFFRAPLLMLGGS
jgi:hypothetical protein